MFNQPKTSSTSQITEQLSENAQPATDNQSKRKSYRPPEQPKPNTLTDVPNGVPVYDQNMRMYCIRATQDSEKSEKRCSIS